MNQENFRTKSLRSTQMLKGELIDSFKRDNKLLTEDFMENNIFANQKVNSKKDIIEKTQKEENMINRTKYNMERHLRSISNIESPLNSENIKKENVKNKEEPKEMASDMRFDFKDSSEKGYSDGNLNNKNKTGINVKSMNKRSS